MRSEHTGLLWGAIGAGIFSAGVLSCSGATEPGFTERCRECAGGSPQVGGSGGNAWSTGGNNVGGSGGHSNAVGGSAGTATGGTAGGPASGGTGGSESGGSAGTTSHGGEGGSQAGQGGTTAVGGNGGSGAAGTGGTSGTTHVFTAEGITTWKSGAKGAYALLHTNVCAFPSIFVDPPQLLSARGLTASFAAIVGTCGAADLTALKKLAESGHEIANNSWSYINLGTASSDVYDKEIVQSKTKLNQELNGQSELFVFPYHRFNDGVIKFVKDAGYFGAIAGSAGPTADNVVNTATFGDDFRLSVDFFGPFVSRYGRSGACAGADPKEKPSDYTEECRRSVLSRYVNDVIDTGGFGIRMLWGIADNSYQPIAKTDYTAHLDDIKARSDAGVLWVDTPTRIIKYRRAREACVPRMLADTTLGFAPPSTECVRFNTVLSVMLKVSPPHTGNVSAVQSGVSIPVRKVDNEHFIVDIHLLHGAAELSAVD